MITIQEAAELCKVTNAAIYAAIKAGTLKANKVYGRLVLSEKAVREYAENVGSRNGYKNRASVKAKAEFLETAESAPEARIEAIHE